jgi:nucleoside-diphosphate-sugar epimerase
VSTLLVVGCGYLGRRVARAVTLTEPGTRVVGTTRSASRAEELKAWGVEPVVADVLDRASLRDLPSADRAFYCVAYDRGAAVPKRTVYVEGLRNVLESLDGRVGRFVYASSTSVYGQSDGGWVVEDSPTEPASESGQVCRAAEDVAWTFAAASGLGLSVVRYSGLYGPGRVIGRGALERGEPIPGEPDRYLNLIHIDDAGAAAVAVLAKGEPGRVYLASDDRPVQRREYYELAARLLGAKAPTFAGDAGEGRNPEADRTNRKVSNRRIKEELGMKLTYPDIRTGLPAALAGD